MAHHQSDVFLRVVIKGGAFRAYFTDIFMVFLTMRFLPGTHRIAIINACTNQVFLSAFQCGRFRNSPPLSVRTKENTEENEKVPKERSIEYKNGFYMTDLFTVEKVGHHKEQQSK